MISNSFTVSFLYNKDILKIVICDDVQLSIDIIRAYIHKHCADLSIAYDTEILYDGREMVEHWLQHTDF